LPHWKLEFLEREHRRNKGKYCFSAYDEVLLGYQPGKVVPFCRDQCFEDHLCLHHKHWDLLTGKASNCIKSYTVNLYGEEVYQEIHHLKLWKKKSSLLSSLPTKKLIRRFVTRSSERRNQAYSAHYQPESWKRPWEQGLDRYKYKTGLSTIPHIKSMTLRTKTEMVFETLVPTKRNHLTWLTARKNFVISIETYSLGKHHIVSNQKYCCL
jgi:hypothetical protein